VGSIEDQSDGTAPAASGALPSLRTSVTGVAGTDGDEASTRSLERGLTRRDVLLFGAGLAAGAAGLHLAARPFDVAEDGAQEVVKDLADATTALDAGPVQPILAVTLTGQPWYPPDPDRRIAVVSFDSSDPALAGLYLEQPGDANYAVAEGQALVALILRDPHLGCRNGFCASSGWWENPCHGETYNLIGEHQGGPSPRGLDRYPTLIDDGRLIIGLERTIVGPPPTRGAYDQPAAGPHCIGAG
jgi:Rieske Fe-S protein